MLHVVLFLIGVSAFVCGSVLEIKELYNGLCVTYRFDKLSIATFGALAIVGIIVAVLFSTAAMDAMNVALLGVIGIH